MSTLKIISNTIYYGVIPKLSLLISIVILPLTTPYLTTFDYGITGVVSSYTGFIACVAPLGLNLHLTNSFYEMPKNYNLVWGCVLFYYILSGFIFGLVSVVVLCLSLPFDSVMSLFLASVLGSVPIFLFSNLNLAQHLFPLLAKPKPLVFINLFASCCSILVSFVMVYFFKLGFWGMLTGTAVGAVLAYVVFIKEIWFRYEILPICKVKIHRLKAMLKSSLPLVPHTLGFVLLSSSSRIVMNGYGVDYNDIGLFSHGSTMGDYIVVVTTALTTALVPQMQMSYRQGDYDKFKKLYYLCQGVALISSFLVCVWMKEIYSFLIHNEELKQSETIATVMCFSQVLMPLYTFMSISAFVERKTGQLLWLVFIPGFLNLVICVFFIPVYGYSVAIYSTLISFWSQILMPVLIPYFREKTSLWLGNKVKLVVILFLSLGLLYLGNFISDSSYMSKCMVSFVFVAIGVFLFYKQRFSQIL